ASGVRNLLKPAEDRVVLKVHEPDLAEEFVLGLVDLHRRLVGIQVFTVDNESEVSLVSPCRGTVDVVEIGHADLALLVNVLRGMRGNDERAIKPLAERLHLADRAVLILRLRFPEIALVLDLIPWVDEKYLHIITHEGIV